MEVASYDALKTFIYLCIKKKRQLKQTNKDPKLNCVWKLLVFFKESFLNNHI